MAVTLGDAIVYFKGDDAHLSKTMEKSERNTSSWASRLGGIVKYGIVGAAAAAAGAIAGVTATLPALISLGSDAEEMMGKFNVVFGDYAEDTIKSLDEMTKAMGRSKFEARGFASSFQDTFVPMGFARGEAAELSKTLTELVYDVASFNNALEADVARDFQSALVGNTETVRKYGIVITQAVLEQELLNMGVKDGLKNATEQEKVQARLNIIMAGTTDAHGDAIRTGDSWANTMRRLKTTLSDVATEMGLKLLPVFTPLLQRVADLATLYGPQLADFFVETLVPAMTEAAKVIANFAGDAIDALQQGGIIGLGAFIGAELKKAWDEHIYPVINNWPAEFWDWLTGEGGVLAQGAAKIDELRASMTQWVEDTDFEAVGGMIGDTIIGLIEDLFSSDNEETKERTIGTFLESLLQWALASNEMYSSISGAIWTGIINSLWRRITGQEIKEGTRDKLKELLEWAVQFANPAAFGMRIVAAIWEGFKNAWENTFAFLRGEKLPHAVEDLLPKFHSGGIVPGPIGQEQLAVVQGGEQIIPVGGNTYNHYYNQTVNTRAESSRVIQDFHMLRFLGGAI